MQAAAAFRHCCGDCFPADDLMKGRGAVGCVTLKRSGLCPETRPVALPPGPPPKAKPLESITEVMGSKGSALGGVQRQSLWSGFGVKPRAQRSLDIAGRP